MPVVEKYKDMGTVLMGKVESGQARKTQTLVLMPNRVCFFILVCLTTFSPIILLILFTVNRQL